MRDFGHPIIPKSLNNTPPLENRHPQRLNSIDTDSVVSGFQYLEEAIKKKYGGMMPKKPPLISKDHERAYFDSADWALGKQGGEKPKGPLEELRPKLQCAA
ncbi:hypothetical protein AHAS_Ahas07G0150800 [Arachis hypogaea]